MADSAIAPQDMQRLFLILERLLANTAHTVETVDLTKDQVARTRLANALWDAARELGRPQSGPASL